MASDDCAVRPTIKNINGLDISLAREILEEHEARADIAEKRCSKKPMNKYVKRILFVAGVAVTVITTSAGMTALRDYTSPRSEEPVFESDQFREFQSPMDYGVPYQDLVINGAGGAKLKGWILKAKHDKPTIVYVHGASSDVGWAMPQLVELHRDTGCNLVVLNYRNGGLARNGLSQADAMDDMVAALTEIKSKLNGVIDTSKLFVMGEGIGANVAVAVAGQHADLKGLILENPRNAHPATRPVFPLVNTFRYVCPDWLRNCLTETKPAAKDTVKSLSLPSMYYTNHSSTEDNAVSWFNFCNAQDAILLKGAEGADQKKIWYNAISQFAESVIASEPLGVQIRNFVSDPPTAIEA